MSPYAKAARLLLRLVALGLILLCGLTAVLEALKHFERTPGHAEPSVPKVIVNSLLALAGLVLLFTSGKLADKFAKRLDE